jgi:polysaccharide pyruvyl transferase WcaK-like protein
LVKIADGAVLAGGTLINRWGLGAAQECVDVFSKFYVFGTGVADPAFWSRVPGWVDRSAEWARILRRCAYVGVRGPLSAERLANMGINNVEVIGDPVLVFASDTLKRDDFDIPSSIGLNVGWDRAAQWGEPEKIYAEYVTLASCAKKSGWTVRWFVVWPPDLTVTEELAKASDTQDEIYQTYSNPCDYIDLVKSLSVFVGTRLHSVVLATCAYVPSVMLEYRPKCRDYMMSIGHEDHVIRTDEFRGEAVWDFVKYLNSRHAVSSEVLYKSIKPLRDRQFKKAEDIMAGLLK